MSFTNLNDLENYLKQQIEASLDTDVAEVVKSVMEYHVQKDVYEAYQPKGDYVRQNKLMDNIEATLIPGTMTLVLSDVRMDGEKDVTQIVEYGKGYTWNGNLDEVIGSRPFIENTYDDIKTTSDHVHALKKSLQAKGFTVK